MGMVRTYQYVLMGCRKRTSKRIRKCGCFNGNTSPTPYCTSLHYLVYPRKDYIIKHAYVEFISPSGDTQIGINPRFNEQDDDEFRLQDVGVVLANHE